MQKLYQNEDLKTWFYVCEVKSIDLFCFIRFDPSGKGELSDKEMFNVLKIQNKVNCKQEEVRGLNK